MKNNFSRSPSRPKYAYRGYEKSQLPATLRLRIKIRLTELIPVILNFQLAIAVQSQSFRRTVSDTNLHSAKC